MICHSDTIFYPLVTKGITFTEIPDKIAIFLELGNCYQKCKGCHSDHLSAFLNPLSLDTFISLEEITAYVYDQKKKGAQAVVLMGGATNYGMGMGELDILINHLSIFLPVGIYVGLPEDSPTIVELKDNLNLTYLKTGAYVENLGGLNQPMTNQIFWERNNEDVWENQTSLFIKKEKDENDRTANS